MKFKNYRRILLIFIVFIILLLVIGGVLLKGSIGNKKYVSTTKSIAFGCEMIQKKDEQTYHMKLNNEKVFKGDFMIYSRSDMDVHYQVILINNYRQAYFSINDSEESYSQTIYIHKSPEKLQGTKISISTDLDTGLNDCLIVFSEIQKKSDSDKGSKHQFVFTSRFSALREAVNRNVPDIKTSDNYEVSRNNFDFSIALNTELRRETNELIPAKTIDIKRETKSPKEMPIAISLKNSIMGSPFFEQYVDDEKLNKEQTFAILAISDGKLLKMYYSNNRKESHQFYRVRMGKTIILKPKLDPEDLYDGQKVTFLVVSYPFETFENLIRTYRASNWSSDIKETIQITME